MSMVVVKNGKVELRKENGSLIRTIKSTHGDAVAASWDDENILIETDRGKTELRKENGSLIRTL